MVKVLEQGKLETMQIKCEYCESLLEYTKIDVQKANALELGRGLVGCEIIVCPVCGKNIIVSKN